MFCKNKEIGIIDNAIEIQVACAIKITTPTFQTKSSAKNIKVQLINSAVIVKIKYS